MQNWSEDGFVFSVMKITPTSLQNFKEKKDYPIVRETQQFSTDLCLTIAKKLKIPLPVGNLHNMDAVKRRLPSYDIKSRKLMCAILFFIITIIPHYWRHIFSPPFLCWYDVSFHIILLFSLIIESNNSSFKEIPKLE